ncbi:MAG: DUF1256 domain-containing protein [Clostridia bacterium]|nr:DUF1256 domain-containing protein [Clostridia bacterium]
MTTNIYSKLIDKSVEDLNKFLLKEKNKEIVFFCVGNHKIWYDNFSSILSERLKQKNKKFFIYGGKQFPIVPDNLVDFMNFVEKKHSSAKIVLIDNCRTFSRSESGILVSKRVATVAAGYVNKKSFGDYSILLKVDITENPNEFLAKQEFVINKIVNALAV